MNPKEIETVDAMAQTGGSFVQALAEAFRRADNSNFLKLKSAFPEYWASYELVAQRIAEQKEAK